jgi:hypothetical protein
MGVFDSEPNIETIAKSFRHLQAECFIAGDSILAEFGVQSLPFVVTGQF